MLKQVKELTAVYLRVSSSVGGTQLLSLLIYMVNIYFMFLDIYITEEVKKMPPQ